MASSDKWGTVWFFFLLWLTNMLKKKKTSFPSCFFGKGFQSKTGKSCLSRAVKSLVVAAVKDMFVEVELMCRSWAGDGRAQMELACKLVSLVAMLATHQHLWPNNTAQNLSTLCKSFFSP